MLDMLGRTVLIENVFELQHLGHTLDRIEKISSQSRQITASPTFISPILLVRIVIIAGTPGDEFPIIYFFIYIGNSDHSMKTLIVLENDGIFREILEAIDKVLNGQFVFQELLPRLFFRLFPVKVVHVPVIDAILKNR
jgi:hypothetical protein